MANRLSCVILDPETTKVSYKELGIHPKLLARLETEIRRPNGMLLTTGPTGSWKNDNALFLPCAKFIRRK